MYTSLNRTIPELGPISQKYPFLQFISTNLKNSFVHHTFNFYIWHTFWILWWTLSGPWHWVPKISPKKHWINRIFCPQLTVIIQIGSQQSVVEKMRFVQIKRSDKLSIVDCKWLNYLVYGWSFKMLEPVPIRHVTCDQLA